jgi:hypothetical protein
MRSEGLERIMWVGRSLTDSSGCPWVITRLFYEFGVTWVSEHTLSLFPFAMLIQTVTLSVRVQDSCVSEEDLKLDIQMCVKALRALVLF